jgi:hypothetical protein
VIVLVVLLVAAFGVASAGRTSLVKVPADEQHAPEVSVITAAQHAAYRFFNDGRVDAGAGRGLFETDFFKPKPEPAKPPEPPAPTRRDAVLFYRGLAAFPDGARVAYLSLDGRALTLTAYEVVTDGWSLAEFDGERAILAKGEERVTLPFNRRAVVSVAIKK